MSVLPNNPIKMDKVYTRGEYLEVDTVDNDKFGGYFHSQNKEGTRLSLYNVVQFPKGDLLDLYHFSINDIKRVQRAVKNEEYEKITNTLHCEKTETELSKSFHESSLFIFINQVDNKYQEAMCDINSCESIAVGTDGAEMGRKCKVSLLTIASMKHVYIFDIQVMQENAFSNGIRDVLQGGSVVKIIHNARKLSDCLYHKHDVKLQNVFDTQAADILIQNRKTGLYPTEVRKLFDCLNIYLGCGNYFITEKIDIVELAKRPISPSVKENIANNVIYLQPLYKAISEEIMKPFIKGSDFYVNCQRQCNDSEAWYLCSQDKKVPKSFVETVQNV